MPNFSYIVQPCCLLPFSLYHFFLQGNQNAASLRFKTHCSIHGVIDFVTGSSLIACCVHHLYFNLSLQYSNTNDTVASLLDTVPIYSVLNLFPLNSFQASDMVSTSRILVAVVQMCYEAKDWDALNENIMLLTKRRSQLKQV